ncbi:MAG: universal stress protein [Bacteroidota bacterium]
MLKINKILFPTDFSEAAQNAFRYALWFADKYNASIDLLHVAYPEAEPMDFPVMVAQATMDKIEIAKGMMKAFVDSGIAQVQMVQGLENLPNIRSDIKMGVPANSIAEAATSKEVDLIIMGTQGAHSNFEKFIGSVTTTTLNRAPCPVLAVPENAQNENIKMIAYAADLQSTDPYHIWEVGKLMGTFDPILRIVHVEKNEDEKKPVNMQELESFFAGKTPALQVTFHTVAAADVAGELVDFTEAWGVDLMVMHKPKRSFFERLFHRSVIKKEVFDSKVPLLIIK